MGIKGIVLKNHGDLPVLRLAVGHIFIVDEKPAGCRRLKTCDNPKQR